MGSVLFIIGAVFVVVGTFTVLYTEGYRSIYSKLTGGIPVKILAICPLVIGVLLMVSAVHSNSFWPIEILGMLAAAKGVLLLSLPGDRAQRLFSWWREGASEVTWRFGGLVLVVLGVFLIIRI